MRISLLLFILFVSVNSSFAARPIDPYFGFGVAGVSLGDSDARNTLGGGLSLEFDKAPSASVVVGLHLPTGRFELEGSYKRNDLATVSSSTGQLSGSGDMTAYSLMFNSIREYKRWGGRPYLLFGGGASLVGLNDVKVGGISLADDTDLVFAYQVGAGYSYYFGEMLFLDFGYKYHGTVNPEVEDSVGNRFKVDYQAHQVGLLLGIDF